MSHTFLFYDFETTGLNPAFDQIIQFAAIRVDTRLREIERHQRLVKLSPGVVPSPQAMLTHQIPLSRLQKEGVPEIEAIQQIHELFNTPGTISCGFNNLKFDDQFLRFSFYRHLLPPYTHQYANGCWRTDLYPILVMYYLYAPQIMSWPRTEDQEPILSLERLNAENRFVPEAKAHDAMQDVLVTLALARRLHAMSDRWKKTLSYFNKQLDQASFGSLPTGVCVDDVHYPYGLMVSPSLGRKHHYQRPVISLGTHQHYKNQTLWLPLDCPDMSDVVLEGTFSQKIQVIHKKWGEPGFVLPPKLAYGLDSDRRALAKTNRRWLADHTESFKAMVQHYQHWLYPEVIGVDVDASLYQADFYTPEELLQFRKLHAAKPSDKSGFIEQFKKPLVKQQVIRLIGRYYLEHLPKPYLSDYEDYWKRLMEDGETDSPIRDFKGEKRMTPACALLEIDEILQEKTDLSDTQIELLDDVKRYIKAMKILQVQQNEL